jgi:hypothetical protein
MNFGYSLAFKTLDKGLIEQFGPTGASSTIFNISFNLTAVQTGFIFHTIFILVYAFCFYLFLFFLLCLGFSYSINFTQILLLIFGYFLLCLSKC